MNRHYSVGDLDRALYVFRMARARTGTKRAVKSETLDRYWKDVVAACEEVVRVYDSES